MKIMLRERVSQNGHVEPDRWTKDASGAFDFQYFEEAIRTARDEGLSKIQVVVQPNASPQDGEWVFVC
jgi:hypothetical protein